MRSVTCYKYEKKKKKRFRFDLDLLKLNFDASGNGEWPFVRFFFNELRKQEGRLSAF